MTSRRRDLGRVRRGALAGRSRPVGFTLAELVIGLVFLGLVGASIVSLLVRQQRFSSSVQTIIDTRRQIRQAAAMLPSDLRGVSSAGGDIYSMTDSSIDFRATTGTSIVCVTSTATKTLNLVPLSLGKASVMTTWFTTPAANDSIMVYDDGANGYASSDDTWRPYGVSSVTALSGVSTNCPTTTGLLQTGDLVASNSIYQLTLPVAQSATIHVGAAVRFFKHAHYSLYRAADGSWYMGYYDCKLGRTPNCSAIQALAGPLNAYAAAGSGTSGLHFTYYDSTGAATTVPANVARISVVVRGQASKLVSLTGAGYRAFGDSLRIDVGLRNRK